MKRKLYEAVHQLLRERQERVPLSTTWKKIHSHFDIGVPEGKWLKFDREQREILRQQAHLDWGFDPLEGIPDGTRLEVAAQSIDEKIARQRPDDGYVLIKGRLPCPLPTLSPELSLRVPLASLNLAAITQVLVIENLDSFDDWQQYRAPSELNDSLVLYRGHGGWARGTRRLLASLATTARVFVFPDYDPAGLFIAATLPRADALLIPHLDETLIRKGSREHSGRQYRATRYLDRSELGNWQDVWEEMKERSVSIKQQHMLALGTTLQVVARQADGSR
ncbi:hypothetical protein D7241_07625 [Stutzerimonas sp. VN223-3]|uniref:DUF7281 domain-containing protein n=1 Tax=Stutzerimonas sp. VN223-3 TaxID=3384601 RepID=UPI0038B6605B